MGVFVDTEVIRILRESFLSSWNVRNNWYTKWVSLVDDSEIPAFVVKGTVDIHGFVAPQRDSVAKTVYIQWMYPAPWNNKEKTETHCCEGVGGHLLAISGSKSQEAGFDGYVFGFASNQEALAHYIEKLGAIHIGILHPCQFAIEADAMKKILETYTFEQADGEVWSSYGPAAADFRNGNALYNRPAGSSCICQGKGSRCIRFVRRGEATLSHS